MGFFSFFSKEKKETLDKGLSKTKESVFGKIARAVAGKSKVDDEVLDNPSEAAMGVFDIVPFPHGAELSGKTEIEFDLSDAQAPLLAFKGTHTFTMNVIDNKGCRKSIPISLEVL